MSRIIVHGHFYQPPREDPWTGRIDAQPSAAPFHDWNERVHSECYAPNTRAAIPTARGTVEVNNFERLSFNIGPTLMSWMETADPTTYAKIIEADRVSVARLGRGNAIAQAYHHTILPLSPVRDIRTQIRWGLTDFRHRFGREAHGIWLPETAVDHKTLGALIDEGVQFTVLAPHQASKWREEGGKWVDTAHEDFDTTIAYDYMHRDGSGRSISLFFYDGPIARAIAFENAGESAQTFIDLFESRSCNDIQVVHAATDGETYGHHHTFSDLGLAYALYIESERRGIEVTNYSAYLEAYGTEKEVEIHEGEGTSWSCSHGVGRWTRDCGCSTGGKAGWNQGWRRPLRSALEVIRHAADEAFEKRGTMLSDPWGARDRYIKVILGEMDIEEFARSEAAGDLGADDVGLVHHLMELQRNSMSMFTSCGWFFNDVAGIETVQVLRYAARTLEMVEALEEPSAREPAHALLGRAESNEPEVGTGADVFDSIKPSI
jgi:alpha-amylase/alpha-mannosidase (GH57 family)